MKAVISKGMTSLALLFWCMPLAMSAETTPDFSQGVSPGYLVKLLAALALVLAAFFVLTWFLKRFHRMPAGSQGIRVIGGTSIGNKERLLLVEIGGQQLLLGVTPMSVNTLLKLDTPIPEAEAESVSTFESVLGRALKGGQG